MTFRRRRLIRAFRRAELAAVHAVRLACARWLAAAGLDPDAP